MKHLRPTGSPRVKAERHWADFRARFPDRPMTRKGHRRRQFQRITLMPQGLGKIPQGTPGCCAARNMNQRPGRLLRRSVGRQRVNCLDLYDFPKLRIATTEMAAQTAMRRIIAPTVRIS